MVHYIAPRPGPRYQPQPLPPSSSYAPGIRVRPPPPTVGYGPPPVPPDFGYPPVPAGYVQDRRRTTVSGRPGPPRPPPPYVLPIIDEERRESRRHSARHFLPPRPPPLPRPVPPFVFIFILCSVSFVYLLFSLFCLGGVS